jgi:hypothetical protein
LGAGLEAVAEVEVVVVADVMSKLRAAAGLGGADLPEEGDLPEEAGGPP